MATYSGAGRTREPGEMWNVQLKTTTKLDDAGYVLKYITETATNKADLCGATDTPACINYRSTRDPHDMNYPVTDFKTGTELGEAGLPVFREGWAKLKIANNNAVIAIGDSIKCSGSGKVDKYVPTAIPATVAVASAAVSLASVNSRLSELARIVGHAEGKAVVGTTNAPGQDKVLVKLSIRSTGLA